MASPADSAAVHRHNVRMRLNICVPPTTPRTRPATTYSDGSLHARTNSTMNSFEVTLVQGGDRPGAGAPRSHGGGVNWNLFCFD